MVSFIKAGGWRMEDEGRVPHMKFMSKVKIGNGEWGMGKRCPPPQLFVIENLMI